MLIPKPNQEPPRDFFFLCAGRLLNAITRSGRRPGRFDRQKWAAEIRKLETRKIPDQDIDAALSFLNENGKHEFCPVVQSARAFVEKFERITEARSRLKPERIQTRPEIGDQARNIAEVYGCAWPGSTDEIDELDFIQKSLTEYDDFLTDLDRAEISLAKTSPVPAGASRDEWVGLCQYLRRCFQAEPQEFVAHYWLEEIFALAWRLDKRGLWSNNLIRYAWHPRAKRWERFARECVVEYLGDEKVWDNLLAYLASSR